MRRLALLLVVGSVACASPAPPPAPSPPPAPAVPVAASAGRHTPAPLPAMTATPTPLGSAPSALPAPALPLHRFAALESGQLAEIHAVRGRLLFREGQQLFSLSPGQMHREPALEQVLAEPSGGLHFGALSGSYPDGIVADRSIQVPGEPTRVREYVRIAHGRATRIGRAHQDVSASQSESALDLAELPDHRLVARVAWNQGPDPASFLDFVPDAQGPERAQQGFENMKPGGAFMVLRANGAVALLIDLYGDAPVLLSWAPRARHAVQTKVALPSGERPSTLIETTDGVLFVVTEQALYRQTNDAWKREDLGIKIGRAWPYPGGGLLLVSEGAPLLRDARGAITRASWPVVTLEGRKLAAPFAEARCTRESGFWALAADGLGLYHDTAPGEIVDVVGGQR